MGIKWPETNQFLDLKERHVRQRALQARSPNLVPHLFRQDAASAKLRSGSMALGAAAFALVTLLGLGQLRAGALRGMQATSAAGRRTFEIVAAVGSPRWTKNGGYEHVFEVGSQLEGEFQLIQGRGSSTTLGTFENGVIAVTGAATLDVGHIELGAKGREKSRFALALQSGTLRVELKSRRQVIEIHLPQGSVIHGAAGCFAVSASSTKSVLSVQKGKLKIFSADGTKFIYLDANQRITIGASGKWEQISRPHRDSATTD